MNQRLVELGRWLQLQGYAFTTVTPATHARVAARLERAQSLRDIFGWSAPFEARHFPEVASLLRAADACEPSGQLLKSQVRFSSAEGLLFAHSAFPTVSRDSVFFGPDTYRFLRALQALEAPYGRLVDVCAGSGVAGLCLSSGASSTVLADVSPSALALSRVNATLARRQVELTLGNLLEPVEGGIDTVIANPPFLADAAHRSYRDGGGALGTGLGLAIVEQALERLEPNGRLLLYTGAPVISGVDRFKLAVEALQRRRVADWSYQELDVDIFGEELEQPGYEEVERIAAVVLTVRVSEAGPRPRAARDRAR